MQKSFYLIITFIVCHILKLQHIWVFFVPVMLAMLFFRINASVLWEIPLSCLAIGVLEVAFREDTVTLLRILIPCSAVVIGFFAPKKLAIFFPIAACAIFFKNIYAVSAVWAALWSVARQFFVRTYSTTKQTNLQEYKL